MSQSTGSGLPCLEVAFVGRIDYVERTTSSRELTRGCNVLVRGSVLSEGLDGFNYGTRL